MLMDIYLPAKRFCKFQIALILPSKRKAIATITEKNFSLYSIIFDNCYKLRIMSLNIIARLFPRKPSLEEAKEIFAIFRLESAQQVEQW